MIRVFFHCCFVLAFLFAACEQKPIHSDFRKVTGLPNPDASATKDSGIISTTPSASELAASPSVTDSVSATSTPNPSQMGSFSPSVSPSPSVSASAGVTADVQAPSPGENGQILITDVTADSLSIKWTIGSDNKTSAAQLKYQAFKSLSNNLSTVADIEANGTSLGDFIPDVDGKLVWGLSSSTNYYFNVLVKDNAGNKAVYSTASVTTSDITAPEPGNAGAIVVSSLATTSVGITWTAATDGGTASENLQYLVYRSTANNLDTVEDIENNGTPVGSYAPNINTKSLTGLVSSRTYYLNVIVKDQSGNKGAYTTQLALTLDATPPSPGSFGTITVTSLTHTGVVLTWAAANDNISSQAVIEYAFYQSASANIATVATAEANGTASGAYTTNFVSKTLTGLTPNTAYNFNVIARDGTGNKAAYSMVSLTTLRLPPILPARTEIYVRTNQQLAYDISAKDGQLPLVYTMPTAPAGATINSSTGLILFTAGSSTTDHNITVVVTDAASRTDTRNLVLKVQGFKVCVWTGLIDSDPLISNNWILCGGGAPGVNDRVLIDGTVDNQPVVAVNTTFDSFAAATIGGGGVVTVNPGVTLTLQSGSGNIGSNVTVKGGTTTCTTCFIQQISSLNFVIYNNATWTLGAGITVKVATLYVGTGSEGGRLVVASTSNAAEWPVIQTGIGINVSGGVSSVSSIFLDGLKMTNSVGMTRPLVIGTYATIDRLRNIHFSPDAPNAMNVYTYIDMPSSCAGVTINDQNWTGMVFSQGTRILNGYMTDTAVNMGACSTLSPITISGSGNAYGFEYDVSSLLTWTNSTSSTCTWTGAIDTDWDKPGNWTGCTNSRNSYPDQLDWVLIPVVANQPVINGNRAIQGTAVGTGGGKITVNAGGSLYIAAELTDTFKSSIQLAGGSAGCSTCLVQARNDVFLADAVTLTLLPDISFTMTSAKKIFVGESSGRSGRASHFVVSGGAVPANYPVIRREPNYLQHTVFGNGTWAGINVDGKSTAATNSTVSIDGLVMTDLGSVAVTSSAFMFADRFTITKLDHLSIDSGVNAASLGAAIHISTCANSIFTDTTWNDFTIVNDPSPGYSVKLDSTCSAISPITINGQGTGYGNSFASDPDGRLTWQ